jgi:hypothetical protein
LQRLGYRVLWLGAALVNDRIEDAVAQIRAVL